MAKDMVLFTAKDIIPIKPGVVLTKKMILDAVEHAIRVETTYQAVPFKYLLPPRLYDRGVKEGWIVDGRLYLERVK